MQRLNTLWQIANAASTVKDIAQHHRTYHFGVTKPLTFYLRSEAADVEIIRWKRPMIEAKVTLQGAFGWRIAVDQDDVGVYMAAVKRSIVGGFSSARFEVRVPFDTYLVLNLNGGGLKLDRVDGTIELPPMNPGDDIRLLPSGDQS